MGKLWHRGEDEGMVGRVYFGWWVVFGCFWVAVFGWGLGFYGLGVYLTELQRARGWSAGLISGAATLYYLVSAILVALVGGGIGRWGARWVVLGGSAAMGAGVLALPMVREPWQLYAAYLLMAPGWGAMSTTAIAATLAPWFTRRRGLAISLALNGASCGGVLVAPSLVLLSERFGFAAALRAVVGAMACVLVPLALLVLGRVPGTGEAEAERRGGRAAGQETGAPNGATWTRVRALRSFGFWTLAAPFALGLLAQVGFLTHQIAFLRPNVGAAGAGLAVGITTIMAVIGRVGLGLFIDRLPQRAVTALLLLVQATALGVMIVTREPLALLVACAGYGFAVGNLITLPSLIVQREYDAASFGLILGLSTAIVQVTYAFGPALIGAVRDASGGYGAALGFCIGCQVVAAGVVVLRR